MTYHEQADHISTLLKERLGVRGGDLETRLHRAGRLLPRHIRRDGQILVEAVRLQASPKLLRRVDDADVQRAFSASEAFLQSVDVKKRRNDRVIGFLAANAFNFFLIGAAVLAVISWRNLI